MINIINHTINIDLANKININKSIVIKKNDTNSHKFVINIFNSSVAYDLTGTTSRIYFQKADGTKVFLDCTLDNALTGKLSCLLTTQVLSYAGLVASEITIYGTAGEILTSVTFNFTVSEVIRDDIAIESTSEFTALTNALAIVTNITLKADKTYVDSQDLLTSNKVGSLTSLTTTNKTNLVNAINENVSQLANMSTQPFITEKAKIVDLNIANSNILSNTNAISTKTEKSYVDTLVASNASGSPKGIYVALANITTAFPSGNTNTYLTSSDGKWNYWNGSAWVAGGIYQSTGLPIGGVMLANMETDTQNKIGNIFPTVKTEWTAKRPISVIGQLDVPNATSGSLLKNSAGNGIYTKHIFIDNATILNVIPSLTWYIAILEYDINKLFIKDGGWQTSSIPFSITLQANTKYIKFLVKKRDSSDFYVSEIENPSIKVIPNVGVNYNYSYADNANNINSLFNKNTNYNLINIDPKLWVAGSWNGTTGIVPVINNNSNRLAYKLPIKAVPMGYYVLTNYNLNYDISIVNVDSLGKNYNVIPFTHETNLKFTLGQETVSLLISVGKIDDSAIYISDLKDTKFKLELSMEATPYSMSFEKSDKILNDFNDTYSDKNLLVDISSTQFENGSFEGTVGTVYTLNNGLTVRTRLKIENHLKLKPNKPYMASFNSTLYNVTFMQIDINKIILATSGWRSSSYNFVTNANCNRLILFMARIDGTALVPTDFDTLNMTLKEVDIENGIRTNLFSTTKLRYIAHRGMNTIAPENSIPSFIEAGKAGYWGAENDVGATLDGELIVMHDDTVDRMTDGTGAYASMTLSQIKALNIDVGANIGNYPNLKVPTLAEYLTVCRQYGIVPVTHIERIVSLVGLTKFYDTVLKMGFEENIVVISSVMSAMSILRTLSPKIYIAPIFSTFTQTTIDNAMSLGNSGIGFDILSSGDVNIALMDYARSKGMRVFAFMVDDSATETILINKNIDCITTNSLGI